MKKTLTAAMALCAALGAVSLSGAASARAYTPGGSWSESCWNASTRGDQLSATCRDDRGRSRDTSVSLRGCDELENQNGNLVCASYSGNNGNGNGNGRGYGRDRNEDRLPAGAWDETCRDASVRGGTLYATCETTRGRFRDSSLNLRGCGNVENSDGRLVCTQ